MWKTEREYQLGSKLRELTDQQLKEQEKVATALQLTQQETSDDARSSNAPGT